MNDHTCKSTEQAASELRRWISQLYDAGPAKDLILSPGSLIGLQRLFASLGVRRVTLSNAEYYGRIHFPEQQVRIVRPDLVTAVTSRTTQPQTDAIIMSLVSWKGDVLPVGSVFGQIRKAFGSNSPLLIADYSHAGAIGFTSVRALDADIVFGDVGNWIAPSAWEKKLRFLWFRTRRLRAASRRSFRPFFSALDDQSENFYADWIRPRDVISLNEWMEKHRPSREVLASRHAKNLELKSQLESLLGPSANSPQSAIWWRSTRLSSHRTTKVLARLEKLVNVWRVPGRGIRVLCRAEQCDSRVCSSLRSIR